MNPAFTVVAIAVIVVLIVLGLAVRCSTSVVFPAPLMTTIAELGAFLARETAAAATQPDPVPVAFPMQAPTVHMPSSNGTPPVPSAN